MFNLILLWVETNLCIPNRIHCCYFEDDILCYTNRYNLHTYWYKYLLVHIYEYSSHIRFHLKKHFKRLSFSGSWNRIIILTDTTTSETIRCESFFAFKNWIAFKWLECIDTCFRFSACMKIFVALINIHTSIFRFIPSKTTITIGFMVY